jgi:hypothetical protein
VLWWYADRPGRRPIVWLAAITVVGFLLRHDHVAFVGLATLTMLLLAWHVPWRERLRHAVLYAAVSLAMVAPYLAFIQLNGGLNEYRRQATEWAGEERARTPIQWPGLSTIRTACRRRPGKAPRSSARWRPSAITVSPG